MITEHSNTVTLQIWCVCVCVYVCVCMCVCVCVCGTQLLSKTSYVRFNYDYCLFCLSCVIGLISVGVPHPLNLYEDNRTSE